MNRELHEAAMAAKRFHDAALAKLDDPASPSRDTVLRGRLIELDLALAALK